MLLFDIGKTNKKCLLLGEGWEVLGSEEVQLPEIADEDGFPCEDLKALRGWVLSRAGHLLKEYPLCREVAFTAYGASFVHVDEKGEPVAPLYNYLKPLPEDLAEAFYRRYGPREKLCRETASPALGMLNSGLQLYWLKHRRPEVHRRVRWSLHLPQYLSFLFSGVPLSEFTSLGCHTALWDFERADYHPWVRQEGLEPRLAPIVPSDTAVERTYAGRRLRIAAGLHDSSAALVPFLLAVKEPFLLLSTGTWNIALNPFCRQTLSSEDLRQDCLHYLRPDGKPVRAARLFLGKEHKVQLESLRRHFNIRGKTPEVPFDPQIHARLQAPFRPRFRFEHLPPQPQTPPRTDLTGLKSFAEAYHQLLFELVQRQVEALNRARGDTPLNTLILDGGFARNALFTTLLAGSLPGWEVLRPARALGPAMGAALLLADEARRTAFLTEHFHLERVPPPQSTAP